LASVKEEGGIRVIYEAWWLRCGERWREIHFAHINNMNTPLQGAKQQEDCISCRLLGGTILTGTGIYNLMQISGSPQHRKWLSLVGGTLITAGLFYGLIDPFVINKQKFFPTDSKS